MDNLEKSMNELQVLNIIAFDINSSWIDNIPKDGISGYIKNICEDLKNKLCKLQERWKHWDFLVIKIERICPDKTIYYRGI